MNYEFLLKFSETPELFIFFFSGFMISAFLSAYFLDKHIDYQEKRSYMGKAVVSGVMFAIFFTGWLHTLTSRLP